MINSQKINLNVSETQKNIEDINSFPQVYNGEKAIEKVQSIIFFVCACYSFSLSLFDYTICEKNRREYTLYLSDTILHIENV